MQPSQSRSDWMMRDDQIDLLLWVHLGQLMNQKNFRSFNVNTNGHALDRFLWIASIDTSIRIWVPQVVLVEDGFLIFAKLFILRSHAFQAFLHSLNPPKIILNPEVNGQFVDLFNRHRF